MDKYTKYARVYPAIVGMFIPFLLTSIVLGEQLQTITDTLTKSVSYIGVFVSSALVYSAIGYFLREVFRSISKWIFQFPLFKEDETNMPTTTMLLWSEHHLSNDYHQNIAEKVRKDFNIVLLSKQEENNEPHEARLLIVNAVQCIRNVTRDNLILQQYNIEFGFCRNYLGAATVSIVFLLAFEIVNSFIHVTASWMVLLFVLLQVLFAILFIVSLRWRGRAYARQLFSSYMQS